MKVLPENHPLHKEVFEVLLDRGIITSKYKIEIINAEIKGNWATVEVNIIRPQCRKPFLFWKLAIFVPSQTVFWSKSTFHYL